MKSARQMIDDGLPWLSSVLATAGAAVPGIQYFTEGAPPLFPFSAALVSLIGAFIVLYVLWPTGRRAVRRRVVLGSFVVGVVLLMAYWVVLPNWTALPPAPRKGPRWQVGFGLAPWSLTDLGQELTRKDPAATNTDLLMQVGGFSAEGPARVWTQSSISGAGTILVALYVSGFAAWTTAFALLGRSHFNARAARMAEDKEPAPEPPPPPRVEVVVKKKRRRLVRIGRDR